MMAAHRPKPLSKRIKEEAFALADANLYLNGFVWVTFGSSFEVGNVGQSCAGSDFRNGQDGLEN